MYFDAHRNRHRSQGPGAQLLAAALPLLLTGLSVWPAHAVFAQEATGAQTQSVEVSPDRSVTPGDDFYGYANGAWLETIVIPAGKERLGAREQLEAMNRLRIVGLLDSAGGAAAGSTVRKVADFRAAYLDEAAIEERGLTSLKPILERIDKVSDKDQLVRELGRGMRADVDPLGFGIYESASVLGFAIGQSIHGEASNTVFLVQGGLGLPDRESYLSDDPARKAVRGRYHEYIRNMLTLAGFDRPEERASNVLALETEIARSHGTPEASAEDHNADHVWSRAEFSKQAPGMNWKAFFDAAGLGNEKELAVWQPPAVTGLAALVASQPLATWQDYLRFHVLHELADVLPHAFAEQALSLRRDIGGPQPSRSERALLATQSAMSDALGRMYAERYFPAEQKARAERISDNVRAALLKRVEASTWMSPATKASALAKLQTLYVGLGYPDQWEDYSALVVDRKDALGNLERVRDRERHTALARLDRPVDLKFWVMPPQKVGAVLVFQQNSYVMGAALLEAPKYDHASSDAAAYGSLGALIGHDMTHYIDVLGSDYDTEHRMRHWWTPEDMQKFMALAQPLVDQFGTYRPFPDLPINGKLTLSENIADLGGLSAAFDAYRLTLGERAADREYVRSQDREFFIAYAQTQRRKISEAGLRKQATSNDHAPEEYRAAAVRNLDAWYEAFDVHRGQRLYLEPNARVKVW